MSTIDYFLAIIAGAKRRLVLFRFGYLEDHLMPISQ
jgi:hypothetical protein